MFQDRIPQSPCSYPRSAGLESPSFQVWWPSWLTGECSVPLELLPPFFFRSAGCRPTIGCRPSLPSWPLGGPACGVSESAATRGPESGRCLPAGASSRCDVPWSDRRFDPPQVHICALRRSESPPGPRHISFIHGLDPTSQVQLYILSIYSIFTIYTLHIHICIQFLLCIYCKYIVWLEP